MHDLSRRAFVFATGSAVIISEVIFGSKTATAASYTVKDAEGVNKCLSENGEVHYFTKPFEDGSIGNCATGKDLECVKKEKDWFATYDETTGTCDTEPCFLTTACVENIGLDDNCFELRTLREFRDNALSLLPGGSCAISQYYDTAPAVVAAIRASASSEKELGRIYVRYIIPSALAAKAGFNKLAFRIYRDMMADLYSRYTL